MINEVTFCVFYRQSLKHLSVSAPAMRTGSTKSSGGDGSDSGLPPMTTSKSRQKKFHRHFKNVPPDEKVLDCEFQPPNFC